MRLQTFLPGQDKDSSVRTRGNLSLLTFAPEEPAEMGGHGDGGSLSQYMHGPVLASALSVEYEGEQEAECDTELRPKRSVSVSQLS